MMAKKTSKTSLARETLEWRAKFKEWLDQNRFHKNTYKFLVKKGVPEEFLLCWLEYIVFAPNLERALGKLPTFSAERKKKEKRFWAKVCSVADGIDSRLDYLPYDVPSIADDFESKHGYPPFTLPTVPTKILGTSIEDLPVILRLWASREESRWKEMLKQKRKTSKKRGALLVLILGVKESTGKLHYRKITDLIDAANFASEKDVGYQSISVLKMTYMEHKRKGYPLL